MIIERDESDVEEPESRSHIRLEDGPVESAGEKSLQSLLAEDGVSPNDAISITLEICELLRRTGRHHGDVTADNIFVDCERNVRIGKGGTTAVPRHEKADARAIGLLLDQMLSQSVAGSNRTGKLPRLSPRFRRIIQRAAGPNPHSQYLTLQEFVLDLRRENRLEFAEGLIIAVIAVSFTILAAGFLIAYVGSH